jgi:multisubunit Na+/H+ antiporter MnhC subunit
LSSYTNFFIASFCVVIVIEMRQRKSLHKITLGLSIIFISAVRLFVVNGKINKERNQAATLEASSKEENKEQNCLGFQSIFRSC